MIDSALLDRAQAKFTDWQRQRIVEEKKLDDSKVAETRAFVGGVRDRQLALEQAIAGGPASLGAHLRETLGLAPNAVIKAPPLPGAPLPPGAYRNPSIDLEESIGRAWENMVTPNEASKPPYWLLCHIRWIEDGSLGRDGPTLKEALWYGGKKTDENYTRNFLRRTGGIYVRGNVTALSDCTVARAWWRDRLARQVAAASMNSDMPVSRADAHSVLHRSGPVWEEFVLLCIRRLTVMNEPRARAHMVRGLQEEMRRKEKVTVSDVKELARRIARLGVNHSLALARWETMDGVVPSRR